ncbi:unnamed protein product [Euphydryas editha]|uniref:Uncharacterized protein n=1 Tax=Euphydryas editha TaxID=104508 RepID=A0AAU9U7A5_EUPED|nr:unnamed protein product [Euphydryas editha]
MDSQLEVFFEKIKLEMEKQTITLTNTLMTTLESKLKPILEENIQMKSEIEKLQKRVNYFENQKRKSNLVIYGLNEEEKSSLELLSTLKNIVHKELNIELRPRNYKNTPPRARTGRIAQTSSYIIWKLLETIGNLKEQEKIQSYIDIRGLFKRNSGEKEGIKIEIGYGEKEG